MLVWVKEYTIKNFETCKSLCNMQELYTTFKEKHPNLKNVFPKFCVLKPKPCVLTGSEMTLVDVMDWELTCKDLIKKIVCNTKSKKSIMRWCESCPGNATLKELLDQELNELENNENFSYCRGTLRIEKYWQPLQPLTKKTKSFDWSYWWFNKTFLYEIHQAVMWILSWQCNSGRTSWSGTQQTWK